MSVFAALPKGIYKDENEGAVFTCVVPSINGCNLKCPFCFIKDRNEVQYSKKILSIENYIQFINYFHKVNPISLISIQGHEPLLKESWSYTEAILKRGKELGIPTALVTNGTYLEKKIEGLSKFNLRGIAVSLDSGEKKYHDKTRGVTGAFDLTTKGLRKASSIPELSSKLIVSSVLLPDNIEHLKSMPDLLHEIGIKRWVVTSLIDTKQMHKSVNDGTHHKGFQSYLDEIKKDTIDKKIELILDNTFNNLNGSIYKLFSPEITERLANVWRLTPNGHCSIGTDILEKVQGSTACWNPEIEAADEFITGI